MALGATYVARWDMLKKNVWSPKTGTNTNFLVVPTDDETTTLAQLNRIMVLTMMCFLMLRRLRKDTHKCASWCNTQCWKGQNPYSWRWWWWHTNWDGHGQQHEVKDHIPFHKRENIHEPHGNYPRYTRWVGIFGKINEVVKTYKDKLLQ